MSNHIEDFLSQLESDVSLGTKGNWWPCHMYPTSVSAGGGNMIADTNTKTGLTMEECEANARRISRVPQLENLCRFLLEDFLKESAYKERFRTSKHGGRVRIEDD